MTGGQRVFLIRHGQTAWSVSLRHTGRTDIPLTENGRRQADALATKLGKESFGLVLTSPMRRARETCERAGFAELADVEPNLCEWHYGDYEGLTPDEIRVSAPDWLVFRDGCPGGESAEQGRRPRGQRDRTGAQHRPRRCALRPRASVPGVRRALARPAGRGGQPFPAGYRHPERAGLLSRPSGGAALERPTELAATCRWVDLT